MGLKCKKKEEKNLLNNFLQALQWSPGHRCVWSAHALRAFCVLVFDSVTICPSCLHYSHCVPVTLLAGGLFILRYQIYGAYASKGTKNVPAGNEKVLCKTAWPCLILLKVVFVRMIYFVVRVLHGRELRFNSSNYVTCLSWRAFHKRDMFKLSVVTIKIALLIQLV